MFHNKFKINLTDISHLFLILVLFVSLNGCTATARGKLTAPLSGKVGVMFLVDKMPKHIHVGTIAAFQTSEEPLQESWGIEEFTLSHLRTQLGSGIEVVQIEPVSAMHDKDLLVGGWGEYSLNDKFKPVFKSLGEKHGLAAIFLIRPYSKEVQPNSWIYTKGYGIYTRCFTIVCRASALNHVRVDVFSVVPPEYAGWGGLQSDHEFLRFDIDASFDAENIINDDLIYEARERFLQVLGKYLNDAIQMSGI